MQYQAPNAAKYKIYLNDTEKLLAETDTEHYELSFSDIGKQTLIVEALDGQGNSLGVNAVEISIGEKTLTQEFEITSSHKVENNKITTTWNVFNKYRQRKSLTFITCAYDKNNKLLNMVANTAYVEALSQDKVTNMLKLPKGTVKVKNFVWDDFEKLNTIQKEEVIDIGKEEVYLNVSFNSNGGSKVETQSVKKNEKAKQPENPTRTGYDFVGWYEDEALTRPFDFNTLITDSITLHAKWKEANNGGGGNTGGGGYTFPTIPVTPHEDKKPDETTNITEGETPLSPGNDTKPENGEKNTGKKKYTIIRIKSKTVLAKISKRFKKLFTKYAYKLNFVKNKSGTSKKIEVRLPYKKAVKGYKFYVADIKTKKCYKAKYDKKKKQFVFKTDKSGSYAILREKIRKK